MKKWLNKKLSMLSLAFSNVEKNILSQKGETLDSDINQTQRHTQGQLADALVHGQLTQDVMDLRWRLYKIMQETNRVSSEITGYNDDGMPIVKTYKKDFRNLKKVKTDLSDDFKLEMVVDNSDIELSINETLEVIDLNHESNDISNNNLSANLKILKPIIINRDFLPRFLLENYTKKLHVKHITNTDKLLEFYVSKYPDDYNRTSKLFINEIKKNLDNPNLLSIFKIKQVGFVTNKTLGANDYLEYQYSINNFHSITEFDGNYVVKFNATMIVDGINILEKYKQEELELKYKNKVKK
jgi:hypothetical protein